MQQLARQNYLQAEVHTATPQKLQLMLVEAAIKNIHRTKKAWDEDKFEAGFDSLALAQDIVAEILSSLDKEGNPELAGKIASIYVFIFRRLAEGGMTHDTVKLDDALRVLNSERETWRQVCEKFGSAVSEAGSSSAVTMGASSRLDLSTDSSAKIAAVPPKSSGISTSSFAKPVPPKPAPGKDSATSSGVSWDV